MTGAIRLGLIGLGEAGSAIAAGLAGQGVAGVTAFDIRADDPTVRASADLAAVTLAGSLPELVASADVLLCLTKAAGAVAVASAAAASLHRGQIYADLNSASPQVKRAAAAFIEPTGAYFADVAVMAAVSPHRHRVPLLVSGPGAAAFGRAAAQLGMTAEVLGGRVGQASAVKMYRSLLIKGLEALVFDCALGAGAEGAADRVFESMAGSLPFDDWIELAGYLMGRTVAHGSRRAAELREVGSTLTEAGVDPALALAAAQRLDWVAGLGLKDKFAGRAAAGYQEILAEIRESGG
jgi:3-hydroxyisobutyrate dehydrogenase-like beta-hydroxyacid dehydrogenase